MPLAVDNFWWFCVVPLHPAHTCLLLLGSLPKTMAKVSWKQARITYLTCYVFRRSPNSVPCGRSPPTSSIVLSPLLHLFFKTTWSKQERALSVSTYGHLLAFSPAQAQPPLGKVITSKESYLAASIAASVLSLAGGEIDRCRTTTRVVYTFPGGVGGPHGVFPIGPPISIMKRFTSSVCFNFLLLSLKVSFHSLCVLTNLY